jgi:hypothetical protein
MVSIQLAVDNPQRVVHVRRIEGRAHELMRAGDVAGSMEVSKEAVSEWRDLAAGDSRFIPDLARCLGHLGARANRTGQQGEALAAAVESVKFWRVAANSDVDRYGFDLVNALMGLAPQVAKVHYKELFTTRDEATQLLLRLLPTDRARYLQPTADACLRLANIAGMHGHSQKAKEYAEKAVELWRDLARQDLIKHGPQFVRALKRLSMEQLDPSSGWGKAPLRDARRVKLAWLAIRLRRAIGSALRTVLR